jgi:hypothetical protein
VGRHDEPLHLCISPWATSDVKSGKFKKKS